jgi:membrane carboxypeptidase/penicillin-binding protein PbpC
VAATGEDNPRARGGWDPEPRPTGGAAGPRIVSPGRSDTFRRVGEHPLLRQELTLRAQSEGDAGETLYWFVDRRLHASAPAASEIHWPLEPGTHLIVCSDAAGRSDQVTVTIE